MKYSYYNPNLSISIAAKSLFTSSRQAENIIKKYFSDLTGKKYILITNSCRTALYLAYKAIGKKGDVITSPLTCKVAIDPIMESGNKPVFADVNLGDLNINPSDIEHRITKETIAIQAINLGGISCDMKAISQIAERNNLFIVEDCAQSLGSKFELHNSGTFGDIACFSLIKNAYGIGGGILATNSIEFYTKSLEISKTFPNTSYKLILYRFARNSIQTYNNILIFKPANFVLRKIKGGVNSYSTVKDQLTKHSKLQIKVSAQQIKRLDILHKKRKWVGSYYYQTLLKTGLFHNSNYKLESASFSKIFLYNPNIQSEKAIKEFHKKGIEAMHLEHKNGRFYQEKLIREKEALDQNLPNYIKIHDSLISLPLQENFSEDDIKKIVNSFL